MTIDETIGRSPSLGLADATRLYETCRFAEAEAACAALQAPGDRTAFEVLHLGALAALMQGKFDVAARGFAEAIAASPKSHDAHNNLGVTLLNQGRPAEAVTRFRDALALEPRFFEAQVNLGNAFNALGAYNDAINCYRNALAQRPTDPDAANNLATALQSSGDLEGAVAAYRRALALRPHDAATWLNLAKAHLALGRTEDAISAYQSSLARQANQPAIYTELANLLLATGRPAEAAECWRRLAGLEPQSSLVQLRLGEVLQALNLKDEALASFQRALALDPRSAAAAFAVAVLADARGDMATAANHFALVAAITPENAAAHLNLGGLAFRCGQLDAAIEHNRRAIAAAPLMPEAHNNLGNCHYVRKDYEQAIACFARALELNPALPNAVGLHYMAKRQICQWDGIASSEARLLRLVAEGLGVVDPFNMLSISDDPALQFAAARQFVARTIPAAAPLPRDAPRRDGRIRLAYLSADFHEHPVGLLMIDLLERHDRSRFEISIYSLGPSAETSSVRQRTIAAVDGFVDARMMTDEALARRIRDDRIDILVDLAGHTHGNRLRALGWHPAHVQVGYLGFSGTTGASCIDHVLVDPFVVPGDQQANYSERLYHLPGCYMVGARTRREAASVPSRRSCGLPEAGFVFCCFNNSYKISRDVFAAWMRLLTETPGSVLWLKGDNELSIRNLKREAEALGVDASRLVFADRAEHPEYLARYRNADLFLDTFPYNAASTAADALWMGLPIVTIAGASFVSRVAGSLLHAAGAGELVTPDLESYERLALALARDPARLDALRRRLLAGRDTGLLFDIDGFTRSIEAAYEKMWSDHLEHANPVATAAPLKPLTPDRP